MERYGKPSSSTPDPLRRELLQQGWKRITRAAEAGELVDGVVVGRVEGGFHIRLFEVSGFLAEAAIANPEAKAHMSSWAPGTRVSVKVLNFDRAGGVLELWVPPHRS